MKIIHLVSYFQPKMGYQEYFLAAEHKKMGHEVIVVTSDRYFPFPDYENTTMPILGKRILTAGTFTEHGITVMRLPVLFEKSARVWLKGLYDTLTKLAPDIIISHGMYNFNSIRLAYIKLPEKTRFVIDDHMTRNLVRSGILSSISYAFFRTFFKDRIQEKAWKIVGVYQDTVHLLTTKMGFAPDKVQWISMGSNVQDFFSDDNLRSSFRNELKISDGVTVIYTGRLNQIKKVHLLIEVLNEPEFANIKPNLLVVGGIAESYKKTWNNAMATASFPVIYHAPVQGHELQNWFNAADIAAWPAHTTISSLDAAACGCAIICPDYISERIANGNGIAIIEGDKEALKQALFKLCTQPQLLLAMRKKSIEYIQTKLNWSVIANEFLK